MVPHGQYALGASALQAGLQGQAGESMLLTIPMSHIFTLIGCITVPLLYKLSCIIVQTIHPRIVFQVIRDLKITYITSVPDVYMLLLRMREQSAELGSLRAFVCGGSVLGAEDYSRLCEGFAVEVLHGYGLTEFTPVSRNIRGSARGGTIGPPCECVRCTIAASSEGGDGEILIQTQEMAGQYLNREWETRETYRDGWFATGDKGCFEGDHLVFLEEIKDTRKINGNIVDLKEVRNAILRDAQIESVDLQYRRNSLTACCTVARNVDRETKERALIQSLKSRLASYKIPKIRIEHT
jgi:long-chain acyl-CoA synthetase